MDKRIKCLFATLLAIIMVFSVVPQTTQAAEPTNLTVSTQAELNKALNNPNLSSLTIASEDSIKIEIKKNTLPDLSIILDLPHGNVTNKASLKKLTVKEAQKVTEKASGNNIVIKDSQLNLKISKTAEVATISIKAENADIKVTNSGEVKNLSVKGADSDIKVTNNGNLKNLKVYSDSTIALGGTAEAKTNVIVKAAAEGASIEAATPVKLQAACEVNVTLKKGAGNSSISLTNRQAGVKLVNETYNKIVITDSEGNKKKVASGEEASVGETSALEEKTIEQPEEKTGENVEEQTSSESGILPYIPVTPKYDIETSVVTLGGIGYNQLTYTLNGRIEKLELRGKDTNDLFCDYKYTYSATTYVTKYTTYKNYSSRPSNVPFPQIITTTYDTETNRKLKEVFELPNYPSTYGTCTYTYDGDICTSKSIGLEDGNKTEETKIYTAEADGSVIDTLSKETIIYEGNSDRIVSSESMYFNEDGNLVFVATERQLDSNNMKTTTLVITGINKIDLISVRNVNYDQGLRERTTAIYDPNGTIISTTIETGENLSKITTLLYDETGMFLVSKTYTDSSSSTKEMFTYTGSGYNKIPVGKTIEKYTNNTLSESTTLTVDTTGDAYICNGVRTTYSESNNKVQRFEFSQELLNGKTLLDLDLDLDSTAASDMRILMKKTYEYYTPNDSPLDTIHYRYYRLTEAWVYMYEFADKPTTCSKYTDTTYTYPNNTYQITTMSFEDGVTGSSVTSAETAFEPEENVHWFAEAVADN